MPPRIGGRFASGRLFGSDEPWGHVWDALDGVIVEHVVLWVFYVDEDVVVFGRPFSSRSRPVIVGPDQLVQETLAPEDLVHQHLAVVDLAVVQVQVEGPVRPEYPVAFAQAWLKKTQIVVEMVRKRRFAESYCPISVALVAQAIAIIVADSLQPKAALNLPCVEWRVDIDKRGASVWHGAKDGQIVAEVHAIDHFEPPTAQRTRLKAVVKPLMRPRW